MHGKRGETQSNMELWFLLAAFLLAGFAGFELLAETTDRVSGDLIEKLYIARDLALTIDAVYAAPGDVTYTYNLGNFHYYIDVIDGKVLVKKDIEESTPVSYRFAGVSEKKASLVSPGNPSGLVFLPPDYRTIKLRDEDCQKNSALILKKVWNDGVAELNVEGKNMVVCGSDDEACFQRGVSCE